MGSRGVDHPASEDERPDNGERSRDLSLAHQSAIDPAIFESLVPFRDLQRTVAAIDFGGIRAAQQAAAAFALQLPDMTVFQMSIQAHLAQSMNFSAIADLQRNFAKSMIPQLPDQLKWAEGLARSINFEALLGVNDLLAKTTFPAIAETQQAIANALKFHTEGWVKSLQFVDFDRMLEGLDRWIPDNLRDVEDLDAVARLALDEGLPLSWIPRPEIVQRLVDAADPDARLVLLDEARSDILEDCDVALADIPHRWARECEDAIRAIRGELDGPSQSHAANIIDSIVLCTLGPKNGRQLAKERAVADWETLGLRIVGESLTLRPLYRALITWWPGSETPPPNHFARHPTAHAVGVPGLFGARRALIAVMLAVSLTVQFWDDSASAGGLDSRDSDEALDDGAND